MGCILLIPHKCQWLRINMAAGFNFVAFLVLLVAVAFATVQSSKCLKKKKDGSICPRSTNIEIKFKPYYDMYFNRNGSKNSLYPLILRIASSQCCNSITLDFVPINSSRGIEELVEDDSCYKEDKNDTKLTFFFPVFTKAEKKVVFDEEFLFVQLMKSPGPALLMLKSEKDKMKVSAAVAIRESWPLFILIVSLSATVGLLSWFMDHSKNPSQFSPWFYKGSWEGFWWAMVTITTVGYGDKVPITFFSRTLAILWMFCGAIIFSLFTANVTSVLTSNQIDDSKSMIGRKIGVLNSKEYFESNLNVGATIIEFHSQEELFDKLEEGAVDRVLAPNYLDILNLEERKQIKNVFSVVNVFNEPFLVGLALVNKDTEQDKHFITCLKRKVKSFKSQLPLRDTSSPEDVKKARTTMLFHQDIVDIIFYNMLGIGVIAGMGIFVDILRYLRRRSERSYTNEETEMRKLDDAI